MGNDRYSTFAVAEGKPLASDLGFLAQSVIVDNLTPSWLDMRQNVGRFIPPFTYGATFPLGAGVQIAQAAWATPPALQPPTVAGGQAQLTFTSAALTPSNGQQVVVPSQATLCTIASFSGTIATAPKVGATSFTVGSTDHGSVTFNVPPGTSTLTVLSTCTSITAIQVAGVQSGVQYIPSSTTLQNLSGTLTPLSFTFSSAADQQVTLSFGGAGSTGIIELSATSAPQAVNVENNSGLPVFVQSPGVPAQYATQQTLTTAEFATPVVVVPPVSGGGVASQAAPLNINVAVGANATIVAGSVGVRPYILAMTLSCETILTAAQSVLIHVQDTNGGSEVASHTWQGVASSSATFLFGQGVGMTSGAGIRILNNAGSAVAVIVRGTIVYMLSNF